VYAVLDNQPTNQTLDAPIITHIFKSSIREGYVPTQWKQANIIPLFKKGSRKKTSNYRPVSLTCICCKLLEKIIRNQIVEHLESQGLININQHGFRKGRSCGTQLLEVMEGWSNILDEGQTWDCVYMDYAKAFDSVPHMRLLEKLNYYGIRGKVWHWIKDFLSGRVQRVGIDGDYSDWLPVTSGIPQGSVLGPILFTIFINDLPDSISSNIKLFADDTKLFRAIESNVDICTLQEDINNLLKWSSLWQLPFNLDKCKVIHYCKNNPKAEYKLGDQNLGTDSEEKDLGVLFNQDLSFNCHISKIINKANSRVGLIKRCFSNIDKEIFLPIYKALVRPILEYCSSIWFPIYKHQIMEIEKIQKRATKLVKEIRNKSYSERLKYLNLDTLHFRRLRSDMLQTFRIIKGIDNLDVAQFFHLDQNSRTRGHKYKLKKPRATSKIRQCSFTHRVVNPWNSLKNSTVECDTLNSFKTALGKEWQSHPLKYNLDNV
jgi:hypothetical protein